jgi:hypothetical protein
MFGISVALYLATLPVQPPSSWGTGGISAVLYAYLPFLFFPLVGVLIAIKQPTNLIGWICLAVGLLWMLGVMSSSYAVYGLRVATPSSLPFPAAIGSLGEGTGPTAVGLLGTYLILLFPDGKLPSRRWRPLAWLSGTVIVLYFIVGILAPGPLSDLRNVSNPFGLESHPWMADARDAVGLLLPLCMLASALSLVLRYRRSGREVREQIKWIAFAASVLAVTVSVAVTYGTFTSDAIGGAGLSWGNILEDMITLSFAGVPIAVGFAVLKYRLYDIDVVINRTLVYGPLTATLVLFYVGGVVFLQYTFRLITGQGSQMAIVASTLAIAALFNPLRRRVQAFVDRRFYRRKYDAAKTLEAFSAKLRDETDLDMLNDELVGVVRDTMQPAHVSLWLRPDTAPKGEQAD